MPARQNPTPDEDFLALERALNWRASPPLPWNSLAGSLGVHLAAAILCMSTFSGLPGRDPASTVPAAAIRNFVPLAFPSQPVPKQALLQSPGHLASASIEIQDVAQSKVTVNFSSIKLSIAPDLRNQLPDVIQAQHGMLALLDKDDLSVALYLMQPPGWKPNAGYTDISRRLRFKMEPPRKWPVFRDAADRYGIPLDRYVGCAVFDSAFGNCLKAEIRRQIPPGASGPVSTVHLAFAADHACGIQVLEVSLAGKPIPRP